ncbi:toll/interleukin-1 receptor domain-containing protein [Ulvibacter antarcticus]|uniref:TIR domain-containing protein n=1 Tax=Ulvibacter antarcticus TaxID=442714 RepID=A0A3L9Z1X0_9FLAO|nr:toll/interleukin-1 receptor domain-containing protein [Ulvibacter antarcticus]RMA64285.1 TIR domain-containing protein [Ulvibacter antarcticus]
MSKPKIFVSYSRADTEYVSKLVVDLRAKGFDVWFDKNIVGGNEWDNTLEAEIQKSDVMVLILSAASVASENVKDEMSYAMSLDKSVNPIKIEECTIPMRLARKQYTDFTVMGYEQGITRLVNDIRHNLNMDPGPSSPIKPVKTVQSKVPQSSKAAKSSKMPIYIVGAVVVIALLLYITGVFGGDVDGDLNDSQFATENSNANFESWDDAVKSRSIEGYVDYIKQHGLDDVHYEDAQDAINSIMGKEGIITYKDPNNKVYLSKVLYSTNQSELEFGNDDGLAPNGDDILIVNEDLEVFGKDSGQLIPGEILYSDQMVRVIEVTKTEDNYIFIYVAYSK